MILLILAGLVYTVWQDSVAVAVLTGALILYRAQRPSQFANRLREARYRRQAAQVGSDDSLA
jgi:hypothetical protein